MVKNYENDKTHLERASCFSLMASAEKVREAVEWYAARRPSYEALAKRVESILREALEAKSFKYHHISARAKEVASYKKKASKQKYVEPIREITDMAGVRVVTHTQSDESAVADIVKELFDIRPELSIDKTKELGVDKAGYRALHFVGTLGRAGQDLPENQMFDGMCFEIQVMTMLADAWATFGHDRIYKFQRKLPQKIRRGYAMTAGGLETIDGVFDSLAREIESYPDLERNIESDALTIIESNPSGASEHVKKAVSVVLEIEAPHFMQDDCEQLILGHLQFLKNLQILERKKGLRESTPLLTPLQIVEYVGQAEGRWFSKNDLDKVGSGEMRWQRTARDALLNLKRESLIEATKRNRYEITDKGSDLARQWWAEFALVAGSEIPPPDHPLGISFRKIRKAAGTRRPHLFQSDFEREILRAFQREPKAIVSSERIVEWIGASLQVWFRSGDFAKLDCGVSRWERTAHWAVSNLRKKRHIEEVQRNRYWITQRGLKFIDEVDHSGMFMGLGMIPAWNGRPIRLDPDDVGFP